MNLVDPSPASVVTLRDRFDGYVLIDEESGQEYPVLVEFAPFQKVPHAGRALVTPADAPADPPTDAPTDAADAPACATPGGTGTEGGTEKGDAVALTEGVVGNEATTDTLAADTLNGNRMGTQAEGATTCTTKGFNQDAASKSSSQPAPPGDAKKDKRRRGEKTDPKKGTIQQDDEFTKFLEVYFQIYNFVKTINHHTHLLQIKCLSLFPNMFKTQ